MALPKLYDRVYWDNNTTPAINEDNLNSLSKAVDDIDDRVIALAGTIMEDVPQIQEDLEILEPAIENIDSNVARAETAADDAEDSAETAEYWANVSNPPIPVTKDFASVITVDDAIPKAATDVKVKVEAVQDLHGYDKPWVGGAGLQKVDFSTYQSLIAGCSYDYTNGDATITTTSSVNFPAVRFDLSHLAGKSVYLSTTVTSSESGLGHIQIIYKQNGSVQYVEIGTAPNPATAITIPSDATEIQLALYVKNGAGVASGKWVKYSKIMVSTTASPTYEPYTNICPISGFTEAKVTRTGKNLANIADINIVSDGYICYLQPLVLHSGTYTLSYDTTATEHDIVIVIRDNNSNELIRQTITATTKKLTFTLTGTSANINMYTNAHGVYSNFMIEEGTQATSYEPYNGTDYIIDLDGERYGAIIDFTTGVMSVTHGFGTVNDISKLSTPQISASGNWATYSVSGAKRDDANAVVISDRAKAIAYNNRVDSGNIASDRVYSDAAENTIVLRLSNSNTITAKQDFYNYWEGAELCYELATPITVQLTPTEVQMLQGYNVLSANSGDVYLEYDASMIQRIANEKLDISTFKSVVASSSDFADFKTKVAAL